MNMESLFQELADYWDGYHPEWMEYPYDAFFPLENLGCLKRLVVDMPDHEDIFPDIHRPKVVTPPLEASSSNVVDDPQT